MWALNNFYLVCKTLNMTTKLLIILTIELNIVSEFDISANAIINTSLRKYTNCAVVLIITTRY